MDRGLQGSTRPAHTAGDEEEPAVEEEEPEAAEVEVEEAEEAEAPVEGDEVVTMTRSGRTVKIPAYLRENYETSNMQIGLTQAEERYYATMSSMEFGFQGVDGVEIAMVGAGVGGGFVNTN
jgi:hypothetical protein